MTSCYSSAVSTFETKLITPLPSYALEQLRQRFLFTITTTATPNKSARALLQMAFETEVGEILVKMMTPPAGFAESNVCERRRFIDIDKAMQLHGYLLGPALAELQNTPGIPPSYMDFLRRYAIAQYPRYRMCTIAVVLCLAAILLIP